MKIDPIIAVRDVETSFEWYRSVFGCRRTHGGDAFAVLVSEREEVMLCLHAWGEHNHPTMTDPGISHGNGLILYFKTDKMEVIRQNVTSIDWNVEEDVHLNPNSMKREFSLRDPDGYFLTVTEFHNYEG